jgi:hypothetical protein
MNLFYRFSVIFIFLFSKLFGENNEYVFGTGFGLEYGGLGLQISKKVHQNNYIYISTVPIQPYINAIGISSDLYVLQETNIRTHITYGTTGFIYSNNGFYNVCSSDEEYMNDCKKEGNIKHSLGLSIGINYFFKKSYDDLHLGLDYVLFNSNYFYDWKNIGFSKWIKENDRENVFKAVILSLGYKF